VSASAIDLRSDTLTRPADAMRRAMAAAEVGDDVFGEDPTVRRLEEEAAERLGKEDALFVASGRMANLVAVFAHGAADAPVALGATSHLNTVEAAGIDRIARIERVPVEEKGAAPVADSLRAALEGGARLAAFENTHNGAGGRILRPEEAEPLAALAREAKVPTHLDGARVFNAAVALGAGAATLAAPFDSACFCLSKGLGAPVGSVLTGTREFIDRAREARQHVGGAMRQAGVLAACGLHALEHHVERIAEDHASARRFAEIICEAPGVRLDPPEVETNMVYVVYERGGRDSAWLQKELAKRGVLAFEKDGRIRFVTHLDVTREDVERAARVLVETASS